MNLQTRFLGTVVQHREIKPGDLYLAEDGGSTRLIFVFPNGESELGGLLLNEWGSKSPEPHYPKLLMSLHNQGGGGRIRRIDGEVSVEPIDTTQDAVLAPHDNEHGSGALCTTPDGDLAVYVKWEGYQFLFKLATGEEVKVQREWPYIVRKRWKMVWRDGDDTVTLCEIGGPKLKK